MLPQFVGPDRIVFWIPGFGYLVVSVLCAFFWILVGFGFAAFNCWGGGYVEFCCLLVGAIRKFVVFGLCFDLGVLLGFWFGCL